MTDITPPPPDERTAGELDSIRELTEGATLRLGDHLRSIVKGAEEFVAQIQSNLGASADGGDVHQALQAQVHSVRAFVGEMGTVIGEQDALTDRIGSISEEVIEAAMSVALVSRQSKMLSMNTMIEAARLGEEGRSFVVIAEEMRRLSENIAESNARIAQLSRALAPILSDARENIAALGERASSFTETTDHQQAEVESVLRTLSDATTRTLATGDERLADIIRMSNDALVELQFEDAVSQRLKMVAAQVAQRGGYSSNLSDSMEATDNDLQAGEIELF